MTQCFTFDAFSNGYINIDENNYSTLRTFGCKTNDIKGKVAIIDPDCCSNPKATLNSASWSNRISGGTVYISQKSKIPRALVRNSGYKITIDKEKADYVIIPECTDMSKRTCNICALATSKKMGLTTLACYDVRRTWANDLEEFSEGELDSIKNIIRRELNDKIYDIRFFHCKDFQQFTIYFVPKCKEYIEILSGSRSTYYPRPFVYDTRMTLTPPNEICEDTLDIWKKCDDEMLIKSVLASNYNEYPVTLAWFFNRYKYGTVMYEDNAAFKYAMKTSGILDALRTIRNYPNLVTPKDWNFLQKYLCYSSGVPEEGGFVKMKAFDVDCPMKKATAYKPLYIDEPLPMSEIMNRLEN